MARTEILMRVNVCYDRDHPLIEVFSPALSLSNKGQTVYKSRMHWRSDMVYVKHNRRGTRIREWLANDEGIASFFLEEHRLMLEVKVPPLGEVDVAGMVEAVLQRLETFLTRVFAEGPGRPVAFAAQSCVMYLNQLVSDPSFDLEAGVDAEELVRVSESV